jgi:multidrug efflux pump subunit AcrB
VTRYNGYPSADINGAANPGFSSGQAEVEIESLLKTALTRGLAYEWTELTHQDRLTRDVVLPGTTVKVPVLAAVMMIAVLLVILVLSAQYESWSLPMAIVLIVPMCVLAALCGVWLSQFPPFNQPGDLNIFTQVALVVLVGLACKNAILIVEFAKELEERGEALLDAIIHACRMRLRPILMTSIAFCCRRAAAHFRQRRRQRDASGNGDRRVLRNAWRDLLRHLPDACVLRAAALTKSQESCCGRQARGSDPAPSVTPVGAGGSAVLQAPMAPRDEQ